MLLRQSVSECLAACPQTFRGPHELKVSGVVALVMDTFQTASKEIEMMNSNSSLPTRWTQAGRVVSRKLSTIFRPESASCFRVVSHTVSIPNLPEMFESFRIVQLSDMHFYEFSSPAYYQGVVDACCRLAPDLIVTTGDIIHYGENYLQMGETFLSQLSAPAGKLACMGNHDYNDDYRGEAVKAMKLEAGFKVLVDDAIAIEKEGKRLWISGIDDYKMSSPDPDKAFDRVEKGSVHISLLHNPAYISHIAEKDGKAPALILAGHTHGGQIRHLIVNWLQRAIFHHPYQYGWFKIGNSDLYVTSGIGSASFAVHMPGFDFALYPFRLNTIAEIALFELTSQPPKKSEA